MPPVRVGPLSLALLVSCEILCAEGVILIHRALLVSGKWPPTPEKLKEQWKEGRKWGGGRREGERLKENIFVFPRNAVH